MGNSTVSTNSRSHMTYVYNLRAQTMSLYYNGSLDNDGGGHGPYLGLPSFFQIGNIDRVGSIYFDGCVDEIFFYPFVRTACEIAATVALG